MNPRPSAWGTLAGLLAAVAVLGLMMFLMGRPLALLLDVPSLVITTVIPVCILLGTHGPSQLLSALRAGASGASRPEAMEQDLVVLGSLRQTILGAGALGALLGCLTMLWSLSDPARLGPALAVCVLSPFYAVVASELLLGPWIRRLDRSSPTGAHQGGELGDAKALVVPLLATATGCGPLLLLFGPSGLAMT